MYLSFKEISMISRKKDRQTDRQTERRKERKKERKRKERKKTVSSSSYPQTTIQ